MAAKTKQYTSVPQVQSLSPYGAAGPPPPAGPRPMPAPAPAPSGPFSTQGLGSQMSPYNPNPYAQSQLPAPGYGAQYYGGPAPYSPGPSPTAPQQSQFTPYNPTNPNNYPMTGAQLQFAGQLSGGAGVDLSKLPSASFGGQSYAYGGPMDQPSGAHPAGAGSGHGNYYQSPSGGSVYTMPLPSIPQYKNTATYNHNSQQFGAQGGNYVRDTNAHLSQNYAQQFGIGATRNLMSNGQPVQHFQRLDGSSVNYGALAAFEMLPPQAQAALRAQGINPSYGQVKLSGAVNSGTQGADRAALDAAKARALQGTSYGARDIGKAGSSQAQINRNMGIGQPSPAQSGGVTGRSLGLLQQTRNQISGGASRTAGATPGLPGGMQNLQAQNSALGQSAAQDKAAADLIRGRAMAGGQGERAGALEAQFLGASRGAQGAVLGQRIDADRQFGLQSFQAQIQARQAELALAQQLAALQAQAGINQIPLGFQQYVG